MVKVEFCGLFSPYAHPDVQKMLAAPARTATERKQKALVRKELLKQEQRRQMQGFARVDGKVTRSFGPEHGLSRSYVWGPRQWTIEMEPQDLDRLMKLHEMHNQAFRIVPDVIVVRT